MKIGTKEFSELCFNRHIRVEWVVPIGAAHDGSERTLCDLLQDWLDTRTLDDAEKVFPGLSAWCKAYQIDDFDEAIPEFLADRQMEGFVVSVSQCVRGYSESGKSFDYSFGHTYGHTFRCDTLDEDAVGEILRWSNKMIEKDKARQKSSVTTAEG